MKMRMLLAAAALCLVTAPASAATYILNLTGTVSSGTTGFVESGGFRYDFFNIVLNGFDPLTLEVGDEIQANITLTDQSLFVPSATSRNQVDLILLNSAGGTITTGTSGTTELFDGGLLIASGGSGSTTSNQVVNTYLNFAGNSFSFDTVQSNFTVTELGAASLDVDYPLLRYVLVNPVAPVPEPATWALMIVGFGAVGSSMRRRKTTTVSFA